MDCPKCGSTKICINNDRGRIHASNRTRSWLLPLMQLFLRAILWVEHHEYGALCKCADCGHKWFAKRRALEQKYLEHLSAVMGKYSEMTFPAPDGQAYN